MAFSGYPSHRGDSPETQAPSMAFSGHTPHRGDMPPSPGSRSVADLGVIIVAGGSGSRMQTERPKQFLPLKGKTVLQWSLECFDQLSFANSLTLVLPGDWLFQAPELLEFFHSQKPLQLIEGGKRRQDSVKAGLAALPRNCRWVAVHDGARPGITPDIVTRAFEIALAKGNAVVALPVVDTLVKAGQDGIEEYIDRSTTWSVQTPQIFPVEVLKRALESADKDGVEGTDDSGLVRRLGIQVFLSEGSRRNMKITSPEDIHLMEAFL